MRRKAIGALGCVLCLALLCTLAMPSQASARGGRGWLWALPVGAAAVVIAGATYYTYHGVYYRPADGGYVVVPAPVAVVPAPPAPVVVTAPNPALGLVVVTSPSLNLRTGPGYNYPVVLTVGHGSTLELISSSGRWLSVRAPGGALGWVDGRYTRPEGPHPNG